MEQPLSPDAAKSFDRSAGVYDDYVAPNRAGARRLVASVPDGRYPRLLDVACGTGFASLAAIPRLGVESVIGVDASAPMLEQFRERLAEFPRVRADLRACDVLAMDVEAGSVRPGAVLDGAALVHRAGGGHRPDGARAGPGRRARASSLPGPPTTPRPPRWSAAPATPSWGAWPTRSRATRLTRTC